MAGCSSRPSSRPEGLRHQLTDYDALLERLGAAIPAKPPRLDLTTTQLEEGRCFLQQAGIRFQTDAQLVGVFSGRRIRSQQALACC